MIQLFGFSYRRVFQRIIINHTNYFSTLSDSFVCAEKDEIASNDLQKTVKDILNQVSSIGARDILAILRSQNYNSKPPSLGQIQRIIIKNKPKLVMSVLKWK